MNYDRRWWPFMKSTQCQLCHQQLLRVEARDGEDVVICPNCDAGEGVTIPEEWMMP